MGSLTESANNLMNTPSKNGIYLITNNTLGCPETYGIFTNTATEYYTYQLFTRFDGDQWMRTSNESQWYDWTKIAARPLQLVLSNNTTWCDIYDQFAYMTSGVLTFGARVVFKGTPGTWVDLLSINTYVSTPIGIYFDVCSRNGRPVSLYFSNNQDSHTKLISGQQFVVNDEIRFTLTVPILS